MAKKTETTATEVVASVEPVAESKAETTATEQKKVTVRLPRLNGHNADQTEFFSVNFKNYLIKRGERVEVPPELEEVIVNGEKAEEAAFEYATVEKALREAGN